MHDGNLLSECMSLGNTHYVPGVSPANRYPCIVESYSLLSSIMDLNTACALLNFYLNPLSIYTLSRSPYVLDPVLRQSSLTR